MQRYLSLGGAALGFFPGAACVFSLAFVATAQAAPVTAADLAGKTICWDNGSASSYSRGGKYSNNVSGEGTWAMIAGGVHIHTDHYDYDAVIQKLGDGTFHAVVAAGGVDSKGKYCK